MLRKLTFSLRLHNMETIYFTHILSLLAKYWICPHGNIIKLNIFQHKAAMDFRVYSNVYYHVTAMKTNTICVIKQNIVTISLVTSTCEFIFPLFKLYVTVGMKKRHETSIYKLRNIVYSIIISADIPIHSFSQQMIVSWKYILKFPLN